MGGQSYYNNTLKIKAKGGRRVEGGTCLVETTGSLTQTGVLAYLCAIQDDNDMVEHEILGHNRPIIKKP